MADPAGKRMWIARTAIFTDQSQRQIITLQDGFVVAVLIRTQKPLIVELGGQGQYKVDCPENVNDLWPIAICVVDRADAPAWESLTIKVVDRILDRCARAVERHRAGQPINNGNILNG